MTTTLLQAGMRALGAGTTRGIPDRAHPSSFTYRIDIDGLRALAVLPVMAFHMGIQRLSGGFVGVDIFFVISGYLISARIIADVENRRFSIIDFYLRRIRRIFPALFVMLAGTTIAAAAISYPSDFREYGRALVASALSVSNIYFWSSQDYFSADQAAPLLHTWSLAVEEQFYLLFPPLILVLFLSLRQRMTLALWLLLAASLLLASVEAFRNPTLAFYWPHTRIWEFLIGTLLVRARLPLLDRRPVRDASAFFGLAIIVASFFIINKRMPFPGLLAVPPCLGAALLIAAGEHGETFPSRLLRLPPVRFIGLISYSLYLWHWPIIAFFEQAKPTQFLSVTDKALVGAATLIVASLSWRFVEQPFRRTKAGKRRVFLSAAGAAALLAGAGGAIIVGNGYPGRLSVEEQRLASYALDRAPPRAQGCLGLLRSRFSDFRPDVCLKRDPKRNDILLIGDSHANHFWHGLARFSGANVMEATVNGCPPLLSSLSSDDPLCREMTRYLLQRLSSGRQDKVILSARWRKGQAKDLDRMLSWLQNRHIETVVVGPVPEYNGPLPQLLALAFRRNAPDLPRKHLIHGVRATDGMIAAVAARHGVRYLSPYRALCSDDGGCTAITPGGAAMQHDYGHLTTEGSDYVVEHMLRT